MGYKNRIGFMDLFSNSTRLPFRRIRQKVTLVVSMAFLGSESNKWGQEHRNDYTLMEGIVMKAHGCLPIALAKVCSYDLGATSVSFGKGVSG